MRRSPYSGRRSPHRDGRMSEEPSGVPWVVSSLFAVSDLHVGYAENRGLVDALMPEYPRDWLIVAGDVAELFADVERTLRQLRDSFTAVIWVPGNHELWTLSKDPVRLRGKHRYQP